MPEDDVKKRIAAHWDKSVNVKTPALTRWWESPVILEHINRLVSGQSGLQKFSQGLHEVVKRKSGGRVYEKGVSVACGVGAKEMELITAGVVRAFDLYEVSQQRIRVGQEIAKKLGVERYVTFNTTDAFEMVAEASVDFVHWNNALHHMLDVDFAVRWSHKVLKSGGLFYLDDYVGPSRFQWSEASLELARRLRSLFPPRYLVDPFHQNKKLSCSVVRPDPKSVIATDPSEAAQSHLILESVRRYFPQAEITLTGGVVYHLALTDVLHNFDEEDESDLALLKTLLLLDENCRAVPELDNHYATALAWKE